MKKSIDNLYKKIDYFGKGLKNRIIKRADDYFLPFKGKHKYELLIFDDIFPHPISGFRMEEFGVLLNSFENSKILMKPTAYSYINTPIREHKSHINKFISSHLLLKKKLQISWGRVNVNAKLYYCVFIVNIYNNLSWLEKHQVPFAFTLYPGGGFSINDNVSDNMLVSVFSSPMFRKVIVTQQYTFDYLVNNKFCSQDKIEFIFGCVVPQVTLLKDLLNKKSYLKNKVTFDICFCAAKYSTKGEDKGYDVFIEVVKKLATKYDFVYFHVIGGFDETDIDVSSIKSKIKFYGYQNIESLSTIYKKMDVLISPNKPFVLSKGAFDGFPLGTAVEAALNGVVCLIADNLKQNVTFIQNEDLIIINNVSEQIENEVINLISNPEKLYKISEQGRQKFINVYSNEYQMKPRINVLQELIANN
jgi:glycosyltransferase involved in cell wall biosynthesis